MEIWLKLLTGCVKKGMSKAEKKAGRIAAEGLTRVAAQGNHAVIFEVNSETDFVAKNEQFLHVLDVLQASLLESKSCFF